MTTKRVLFVGEAVTLAHVARPVTLARALDRERYAVFVACDPRAHRFARSDRWQTLPLESIPGEAFTAALERGKPAHDVALLERYVEADLRLIGEVAPDLIVGDFRLSLAVSARRAGVPYAAITNVYWSPAFSRPRLPLPVLPLTRALPLPVADVLARAFAPISLRAFCEPLNRLRRAHGMPSLGNHIRRVYSDADHLLYADAPCMYEGEPVPANHHYLGPLLWSPPCPLPTWWSEVPADVPSVYVTLGSSGQASLLAPVVAALAELPISVLLSTAGAAIPAQLPPNVFAADYLPGMEAAARAALVICNGGSPTSQQALAAGVPVLGIASNMDQFLNMMAVTRLGAGALVRADRMNAAKLRARVTELLANPAYREAARRLGERFAREDAGARFAAFVDSLLGESGAEPAPQRGRDRREAT